MIRRAPLRRRRPKAHEPRVKGRNALSERAWRLLVDDLKRRAGWRCEVPWCRAWHVSVALDPHHVIPCSLGGDDHVNNVLIVCRTCHRRFDAPFRIGRLVAEPMGCETFRVSLEWRRDKRAPLMPGSMQEMVSRR